MNSLNDYDVISKGLNAEFEYYQRKQESAVIWYNENKKDLVAISFIEAIELHILGIDVVSIIKSKKIN